MMRKAAEPVDPTRIRKIEGTFSWIDHRLITQGWFDLLGHNEILLYLWWTTVGDRNGVSFYSDEKTACRLKISVGEILLARHGLMEKGLIAFRNGVVQVLPLPRRSS
jgi:hypothetical protein